MDADLMISSILDFLTSMPTPMMMSLMEELLMKVFRLERVVSDLLLHPN